MAKKTGKQNQTQEVYRFPINELAFDIQRKRSEITLINVGDSGIVEHLGINANDLLMVKQTQENDENQLSLWHILNTIHCQIGFAFDNFGEISIHSGNGKFCRYKKREVRMIGVVVGIIKPFSAVAGDRADDDEKESIEITLTCAECGKTITGNKKFLLSQGWECEDGAAICLNCDLKTDY